MYVHIHTYISYFWFVGFKGSPKHPCGLSKFYHLVNELSVLGINVEVLKNYVSQETSSTYTFDNSLIRMYIFVLIY